MGSLDQHQQQIQDQAAGLVRKAYHGENIQADLDSIKNPKDQQAVLNKMLDIDAQAHQKSPRDKRFPKLSCDKDGNIHVDGPKVEDGGMGMGIVNQITEALGTKPEEVHTVIGHVQTQRPIEAKVEPVDPKRQKEMDQDEQQMKERSAVVDKHDRKEDWDKIIQQLPEDQRENNNACLNAGGKYIKALLKDIAAKIDPDRPQKPDVKDLQQDFAEACRVFIKSGLIKQHVEPDAWNKMSAKEKIALMTGVVASF